MAITAQSKKLRPRAWKMSRSRRECPLQPRDPSFALENCLAAFGLNCKSVTPLTGGLVNYVWRIVDNDGHSFILKHAEAVVKVDPSFENDPIRLSYEVRGLQDANVRAACASTRGIHVPHVVSYNAALHVLLMTDEGPETLAAAYVAGKLDMRDVGTRLGTFLASLHTSTQTVPPDTWENLDAEASSMLAAAALPDCMERYGYARRTGEIARDEFFLLRPGERACCVHGDLRPGNMLVKEDGSVSVIDWEDSQRQSPAIDLKLFIGQSYILETLHGERGLLDGFLTAYRACAGALCDDVVARKTAIMFGTYLVFWLPQTKLCSDEEIARFSAYGAEVIDRVVLEDAEWLKSSQLGSLF